MRNKKIPQQKKVLPVKRAQIGATNIQNQDFSFRGRYQYLKAVSVDDFTSFLKDEIMYSRMITQIVSEIIPNLYEQSNNVFKFGRAQSVSALNHSHKVEGGPAKLAIKVIKKLHGDNFEANVIEDLETNNGDYALWQLGGKNSVRIIGIYDNVQDDFFPMFVDWHHLLYPDPKNNKLDTKNFQYNPLSK